MGNSNSRKQKNIKLPFIPSTIEQDIKEEREIDRKKNKLINEKIVDNNKEFSNIRDTLINYNNNSDSLNKFTYIDKKNEELMLNSWKAATAVSDYNKLSNINKELLQKVEYSRNEKKTLEEAISNNIVIANMLASQKQTPLLNTKERISEINNDNFREKQTLINRLIYIIYFILFLIGLGISLASGVISMKMLGAAFFIGLLYLIYALISISSFWKAYGDLSMGIAKGAVKGVLTTIGPVKKCPARCDTKKPSYAKYKLNFLDSVDKYEPICGKGGSKFNNKLSPYDYTYDEIENDSKNFEDCKIGEFKNCKDKREKSFVCKWNNEIRPTNEPEYLNSSLPCNNYLNRVNVLNSNNVLQRK
jgi:hypothetical protein